MCVCVEMVFSAGQSEHVLEVQVLFDQERETRETFTLHLTPDLNMVAHTQVSLSHTGLSSPQATLSHTGLSHTHAPPPIAYLVTM